MSVEFVLTFPCHFICFLIYAYPFFFLALFSFLFPPFRFFHFYAHQCTYFFPVSFRFNPITHSVVQNIEILIIVLVEQPIHSNVMQDYLSAGSLSIVRYSYLTQSDERVESVLTPGTVIRQAQNSQKPRNILLSDNKLDERQPGISN